MRWSYYFSLLIFGWTSVSLSVCLSVTEELNPDSSVNEIELSTAALEFLQPETPDSTIQTMDTSANLSDTIIHVQPNSLLEIGGRKYNYPMGDISFVDSVVFYDPGAMGKGTGDEPNPEFQNPDMALGPPDYMINEDSNFVSLGRGGFIILKFRDNVLIDGPGPDLTIFETNTDPEDFFVWISHDGTIFLPVGKVVSRDSDIDIHSIAEPEAFYRYVKIRDDPDQGEKNSPSLGADIDAVGAIHSAIQKEIISDRIFVGKTSNLSDQASEILSPIANTIRQYIPAIVTIETYTDSRGTENFNLILTQQQADAIRNYLLDIEGLREVNYIVIGWGETQPIASNDTENGRQQNRRIEIMIQISEKNPLFNELPYD